MTRQTPKSSTIQHQTEHKSHHGLSQKVCELILQGVHDQFQRPEETKSFFVVDMSEVEQIYKTWTNELPDIKPWYAVKCNPDIGLIKKLASLDINFDCASLNEIKLVLGHGISASRIVYTDPIKTPESLRYANEAGVNLIVIDNHDELIKMKEHNPGARILVRLAVQNESARENLSEKFGVNVPTACELFNEAWNLELDVVGICFHLGPGSSDPGAFRRAIEDASIVFNFASELGQPLRILDIGGGYASKYFAADAAVIRAAVLELKRNHEDIEVIAEPGRMFARSAFTLVVQVLGRRRAEPSEHEAGRLYLNDGVYGNLMGAILEYERYRPIAVIREDGNILDYQTGRGEFLYSLWGPTCDSTDRVSKGENFDKDVEVGDWLVFRHMGAYTRACRTSFNGFDTKSDIYYAA